VKRDLLIGDVFRNARRAVPDRVAVAFGDNTLTFAQVDRQANAIARALSGLGVRRADRVAVWDVTSIDTVPVFAALAKMGAVFAPVNPALSVDEVSPVLDAIRPTVLLVGDDRATEAESIPLDSAVPVVCSITSLGDRVASEDDSEPSLEAPTESDAHVIFLTSGSTGRPKAAIISHRVNFLRTHPGAMLEPRGPMVCPYPLFHMGAWTIALQQWQARDRVIFVESADAVRICDAIERHQATRLNCIPAVWRRILDHLASPAGHDRNLGSIRFADSGTSATPLELLEAIEAALPGAGIRIFYGSTEAGSVSSLAHADIHRKPGSCGVPAPSTEVRTDASGELWVRGPLLFDGYLDDPDATAAALVDGWYRTGDLADVDEDGYLTIVGRARDVIRTGGETVAPAEVEAVLSTHDSVADVAVVGLPDAVWGEVVTAVLVVAAAARPPTVDDLRQHCEGRLAAFKQPRRISIVDSIPRTASTAQVQRRLLVERLG
jgi:acyl-CoA synthetase (AMP-forming)/AMP-acid ligase II